MRLPPVKSAEAGPGVADSQPVLLYEEHGDVVGSEQAQFLTSATDPNDPAYMDCGTPEGLTTAYWSDTVELSRPDEVQSAAWASPMPSLPRLPGSSDSYCFVE
jgi:hypothetical protein